MWPPSGWQTASAIILSGLFLSGTTFAAEPDPLLTEGFELVYNLDHEAAIDTFTRVIDARPDDPVAYRSVAATIWLRILFLRGTVLVDNYPSGSISRSSGKVEKPPDDLVLMFEQHVERAIELSEAAVRQTPEDVDAYYELGVAVGLAASYRGSVAGEPLRALRDAKRAYEAHEQVLKLDPSRDDAKLLIGVYRYIVSTLPRPIRMMAYLVGFDGGKKAAIKMVNAAAAYPGPHQAEAQFALVLLLNREREYARAQRVLTQLRRTYPRNRLVWLETASTWLRDERPAMAELILAHGFSRLQGDNRTRMLGEDTMWHLKRGTARAAVGLVDTARIDLARASTDAAPLWVSGRAHLELGKIADVEGDRSRARTHYDQSKDLCDDARDRRCEQAADHFLEQPYTGPAP